MLGKYSSLSPSRNPDGCNRLGCVWFIPQGANLDTCFHNLLLHAYRRGLGCTWEGVFEVNSGISLIGNFFSPSILTLSWNLSTGKSF